MYFFSIVVIIEVLPFIYIFMVKNAVYCMKYISCNTDLSSVLILVHTLVIYNKASRLNVL